MAACGLFDQGLTIPEVAEQLSRANSTVLEYLIDYIAARRITDPTRWVEKSSAEAIAVVASYADSDRLRPIHDALRGLVDYEAIKIVVACEKNRNATATRLGQDTPTT